VNKSIGAVVIAVCLLGYIGLERNEESALEFSARRYRAGAVFAAVTFDPETGTGFVGKGDVQTAFGWNNKQLQDNAGLVQFRATTTSETTWTCIKESPTGDPNKDVIQERSSETTT
jgi:hypothetical protein